jgi:hypothetical protein
VNVKKIMNSVKNIFERDEGSLVSLFYNMFGMYSDYFIGEFL